MLELNSAFQYTANSLSQYEQNLISSSFSTPNHSWNDFRCEALKALEQGFGKKFVGQGNKSIKLKANRPRLAADVVVCMEHRTYTSQRSYVAGVVFQALRDKLWIVNYPKQHYDNGAEKSKRTGDRYKRTVRMFKNARNHLEANHLISSSLAPSYFLECLLYNAPDSVFQSGFQQTYYLVVKWMAQSSFNGLMCQNGQQNLFGNSQGHWSIADAKTLANCLVTLWNDWK